MAAVGYIYIYIYQISDEYWTYLPRAMQGPRAKTKSQGPRIKDADIHTHELNSIRSHAFAKLYWICCKHVLTRTLPSWFLGFLICNSTNALRPFLIFSWASSSRRCTHGNVSSLSWASSSWPWCINWITSVTHCSHSSFVWWGVVVVRISSFSRMLLEGVSLDIWLHGRLPSLQLGWLRAYVGLLPIARSLVPGLLWLWLFFWSLTLLICLVVELPGPL